MSTPLKAILAAGIMVTCVWLSGCSRSTAAPRYAGRIVSHVDTYGSGTGVSTALTRDGSMGSGFNYGDPEKPDWNADIKWSFLRHDGTSDKYRVEVAFRFKGEKSSARIMEVSFNGSQPAMIPINDWLVVSMEATSALDEDLLRPKNM